MIKTSVAVLGCKQLFSLFFEAPGGNFMEIVLYTEINLFCLLIMLVLFLSLYHPTEKNLTEQALFLGLIYTNTALLLLDTFMWLADGRGGSFLHGLYLTVTALYYLLSPAICFVWMLYADYRINKSERHLRKLFFPMLVPFCINAVLSLGSIFYPLAFSIDSGNVYMRGQYFIVMAATSYFYLFFSLYRIWKSRKMLARDKMRSLFLFPLPSLAAGIVQWMFYGLSVLWLASTLSILIVFINLQNHYLYSDHLTGLYNRRQLDTYLDGRVRDSRPKKILAGVMIDLDSFKMINDVYGHDEGDQALKQAAAILSATFGRNSFIARYGGDEFVVIMEIFNRAEIEEAVSRLQKNAARFNEQKQFPFRLGFSVGYDIFDQGSGYSASDFIRHIDTLMYAAKAKNQTV